MTAIEIVQNQMRDLILTNCNTIGCDGCGFKWAKDSDGNSCRSDYLMQREMELKENNAGAPQEGSFNALNKPSQNTTEKGIDPVVCVVCAEEMPLDICAYWNIGPNKSCGHIGCIEKKIEVFKIEAHGQGSFFYDTELPNIIDLFDGSSVGDGYLITIEEMSAGKFYTLPEFEGF